MESSRRQEMIVSTHLLQSVKERERKKRKKKKKNE
jgi:hypothetical protein